MASRPPIVTIMGHVDHGKTTLLDHIRESRVAQSEKGGITQHIGAYQVVHNGKPITFIDTPGHAAFSQMRVRGANVTDIVILVVAANDGVKPQTAESIKLIQAAKVPYIVAINKVDLPEANPSQTKTQLMEHEVFVEGYGGQVPCVEISALQGQGIDDLLETIVLVAEMENYQANPKGSFEAVVIETRQDKHKGALATIIVKSGSISERDSIYVGQEEIIVKAMHDATGKRVYTAGPGSPVEVMGFNSVPSVGITLTDEAYDMDLVEETEIRTGPLYEEADKLYIILKADTLGTLEAIQQNIHEDIHCVHADVGPVNESDMMLAQTTGALIIAFTVPIIQSAKRFAEIEQIEYKSFDIIYELFEYVEKRRKVLLEPFSNEEFTAEAEVLAIFDIRNHKIAGCKITKGKLQKQDTIHHFRNDELLGDVRVRTIQKGKDEVEFVKAGNECGISLSGRVDIQAGDVLKSYKIIDDL